MNIQIINQNDELFVDSRTVATGFGIEHKSLCKSLQEHFRDLKSLIVCDGGVGRSAKQYLLTERQTMVVPAICRPTSKTIQFQMALVDAFLAMRSKAVALPTDPMEQAMLLASQLMAKQKQVENLETKVLEDKPKVAFADTVIADNNITPLGKWGIHIGIGQKKVFAILTDLGFIGTKYGKKAPYAKYGERGKDWLRIKSHPENESWIQIYITGLGKIAIHAHLASLGYLEGKKQLELFND